MTADEIEGLITSLAIPRPPSTAADNTKLQWLQVQLLAEIARQKAAQTSKVSEFVDLARRKTKWQP
jgi:hypothetical protein